MTTNHAVIELDLHVYYRGFVIGHTTVDASVPVPIIQTPGISTYIPDLSNFPARLNAATRAFEDALNTPKDHTP